MARALITGAGGFIGANLAEALIAQGKEITCLVRRPPEVEALRRPEVRLVTGDVTDAETLAGAVNGVDVVYHLAGLTRALRRDIFEQVNHHGTRLVAEACARRTTPPVLVVVSSLAAAGPSWPGRPRTEMDQPAPVSNYGRSKRAGEQAVELVAGHVPATIVRPAIVLGPRDRMGLSLFDTIQRLGLHPVPGWRRHEFSVIHSDDLTEMLIRAAERGRRVDPTLPHGSGCGQGIYFAACEETPSYAELGRMVGRALGRRWTPALPVASPVVWAVACCVEAGGRLAGQPAFVGIDKTREATAGDWVCSPQRAIEELGIRFNTPLAERLGQTVEWYRAHGWLPPARRAAGAATVRQKGPS